MVGELLKSYSPGKKRSVVLNTNALQYLNHPRVDRIIVIQDGRVVEEGSYSSLSTRSNSVFARFLAAIKNADVSESLTGGGESQSRKRYSSASLAKPTARSEAAKDPLPELQKLVSEESRETGQVSLDVYLAWVKAAGGFVAPFAILFLFAAVEGVSILSNWWLTYWSAHATAESQATFLGIYALINAFAAVAGFFRVLLIAFVSLKASRAVSSEKFCMPLLSLPTCRYQPSCPCSFSVISLLLYFMRQCRFLIQPRLVG